MGKTFFIRKRDPFKYIDSEDFIKNAFKFEKDFEVYK
jgi:hypothetical protein